MLIRRASAHDACAIAQLERRAQAYPWSEQQIRSAVEGEVWVIHRGEALSAWLVLQSVLDEAEILNIAVDPGLRRQGLAGRLLSEGLRSLRESGVKKVFLEVRAGNAAAQSLYSRFGFVRCGVRGNYYRNGDEREDAVVMRLSMGTKGSLG